jgi:hypothetical protein
VEGPVDAAAAQRLIRAVGAQPGRVYIRDGKPALLKRGAAYNRAARWSCWLVLVDLDLDESCPPPARSKWLPCPSRQMCFRIVVREIEAWLLADRANLARFLRVAPGRIPAAPETLDNPKEVMVDLARRSRSRAVREDMVPRPGSGRAVGAAYASRMIEFAESHWTPEVAAMCAPSLARALACLRRIPLCKPLDACSPDRPDHGTK